MGAIATQTRQRRREPESGVFARHPRRTSTAVAMPAVVPRAADHTWVRLGAGFAAMGAFVAAGLVHAFVGTSEAVYVLLACAALTLFGLTFLERNEPRRLGR